MAYVPISSEWIDTKDKIPKSFALVELLGSNNLKQKGWWTGNDWDFYPVKISRPILKWRKIQPSSSFNKNI